MKLYISIPGATAFALILALSFVSVNSEAKIVCWKDKEGVRSCGNAVPPEYAQQGSRRISKSGVTINKTTRAKTPEELKAEHDAKRVADAKAKEQHRIAAEQARKDRVLLQTYNSQDELELARDGKIAVIDSRIKHNQQVIKKLQGSLENQQNEAANLERSGKKVPEKLRKKLSDIKKRIGDRSNINHRYTKEQIEVRKTFAADIARYRELKGIKDN